MVVPAARTTLRLGLILLGATAATAQAQDPAAARARLLDRVFGALAGSAIGDALGAPTEMWPRDKIEAHFKLRVELRDFVREPSPEGIWSLNPRAGTTTDDTRWKQLVVDYCAAHAKPAPASFAEFLIKAQDAHFARLRAIEKPDLKTYVDGVQRLLWLDEWVRVARAYTKNDVGAYSRALNKFYGGEMVCAGLLFAPVFGAAHPGDPLAAYRTTFEVDLFDIGYARDVSAVTAAMIAAAMRGGATADSVLAVLTNVDPHGYFESRLVGRIAYKLFDDARQIVHRARKAKPKPSEPPLRTDAERRDYRLTTAFELLDKASRQYSFHAGEIHLVNLSALLWSDFDFREAMRFVVSYGRDNDTTAAVTGAIIGALRGASALPKEWVEVVVARNRERGIDLEAMAKSLVKVIESRGAGPGNSR